MMRSHIALLLILVAMLLPGSVFATNIESVRIGKQDDATRLVIETDSLPEYFPRVLQQPNRVSIDVPSGNWNLNRSPDTPTGSLVQTIRHGQPSTGNTRIIADLDQPGVILKHFVLPPDSSFPNYRIVLDIAQDPNPPVVPVVQAPKVAGPTDFIRIVEKPHVASPSQAANQVPASMRPGYKTQGTPFAVPAFDPGALPGYGNQQPTSPVQKYVAREVYKPVIVIDAGHGGVDPGAIGRTGVKEKDITLSTAHILRKMLIQTGKYRVVLTRSNDAYIGLRDRVKKARELDGDLFISLHADSHPKPSTRGLSVYTISEGRSKREGDKLLRKADREEVIRGVDTAGHEDDVQRVLIDMAQRETKNSSATFAELVVRELGNDAKLLRNTHRFAGFAVLTGADLPSVLIELGYLSNASEESLLRTENYRTRLSRGITDAINAYFLRHKT